MASGRRVLRNVPIFVVSLLAAAQLGSAAGAAFEDKLTEFDFLLLGLTVRPEPVSQVVPRNTATGIRIEIAFSDVNADAAGLLALLPANIEVAAELVGPGIADPIQLRGPPGDFLPVPPIERKGVYLVRDIRLEKDGVVFLRAAPDSATVEVIDRVLVTQVTTRPLTLEEIRQKGILFGDDSFTGFNFTLALKLDSRPVTIDFPVIFDSNEVPVPIQSSGSIGITGSSLPVVNTGIIPVMMKPNIPAAQRAEVLSLLPDIQIPGLIVIPGDVGFLNQFFSALLIVANGAPGQSGLSVSALDATISLPLGDDQVGGTSDDPLVVAETETGGQAFVLPIRGLGADGEPGTNDDGERFEPGQQGQAEFLLEGRGEGFHEIKFDIQGTLEGLPIGPVPITGVARGGVVVRNPFFNMTFTAPATVRAGEEFTLFTTITNISNSIANLVSVSLNQAQLAGATLLSGPTDAISTLLPGDSEVLRFEFRSDVTGQVSASYLDFDGTASTGTLRFSLGVGARGVPLSPDTIVLPQSANALPPDVVEAALRVLGQAWSVATAPSGTLPAGVLRVAKQTVLNRATELAEAGFRVQLGEDVTMALESVAFSWASTDEAAFAQILRETDAGKALFAAIGNALGVSGSMVDFHRDLALELAALPPNIIIGVDTVAAPLDWILQDAAGRTLDPAAFGTLENAAHLPTSSGDVALLTRLGSSLYEWNFTATADGVLDFAVSLPRSDGTVGRHVFSSVPLMDGDRGELTLDLLSATSPLQLHLDRDADGIFEETVDAAFDEVVSVPAPTLIAATAIGPETLSDADPWGRVVALLFDREMRLAEAEAPANYALEDNAVRSATRQLSGRLVFLFANAPVSDLVTREVTVSGLFDTKGQSLAASTQGIASRLVDPGATVSGRVLNADGTPVNGAEVIYINAVPGNRIGISQKTTGTDGRYQFDYVRKSPYGPFAMRARDPLTGSVQELSTRVGIDGENLVVDLVLLGRGGVTGLVTDVSGDPVTGARVLVTSDADPSSFALAETDGEGRYIATNLVVGAVTVKAVLQTSSGIAAGNLQRAGTFTNVDVTINLTAGRVSGGVFEADGQDVVTPIDGIEVYYLVFATGGGELVAASGKTDAFGLFTFQDVPAGDFRIVAIDRIRSRQTSKSGTLTVVGGEALIENFDVLFFTVDVGTLSVSVQDSSGVAVAGALVTAAGRQVLTDSSGQVVLTDLAAGTYSVSARGAASNRSVFATAQVFENQTTNVTLALPGVGRVVVTVFDTAGVPVPNQQVIHTTGGPCAGISVLTDAAGVAVFEDVPVGNVTLKAANGADVAVASTFIQRSGDERAVILRFAGFGTITGTVFDPNDVPAFGANVVLSAKRFVPSQCVFVNDGAAQQVQTGLDGTFAFHNVPLGAFGVSASQPVFFPQPVSVAGVLLADGETRDVELTLSSNLAGELTGTVFLPDGTTAAGVGVDVTVSGGGRPDVTVRTDTLGVYSFASIFPAGRYTLTAADSVTGKLAREILFLQEDQDLTVDLRLLGRAPVEITVVDGAGIPVDDAFVELASASFPNDRAAGSITSLDGGKITFARISEGNFTVTVSDSIGRGGRANGTVVEDGLTARVSVSLSVTGTVRGTLFASDGVQPIPNAEVILRQGSTGRLLGATTTSSAPGTLGEFEFLFVPAGSVLATATDPLTGRIGENSGTIVEEGEVLPLDILQLGLGSLQGSVTTGGAPVAASKVELTSTTGLSSTVANLRASATTDGNGGFMFDGVPVGSFTLKATLANLTGTVTGSVDQDGQVLTDLEIVLEPSGTVVGDVFRADAATIVPGAPLTLKPARGVLRTQADSVAHYRIELVPVGDFSVTAEEPGEADAGTAIGTLTEGEELTVDVVFNGTGTVSGTALESDDVTPLTTGRVRLSRLASFPRDETVNVASDGTFQFLEIPVGDYSLSLTALGLRGTKMGNIAQDGATDAVTIKLADSGNVFGILVRPDGAGGTAPAANVPVTASGAFVSSTLSGSDGVFRIEGIPLGDFTLRAEDPVTGGIVVVPTTMSTNGEELDLGTLTLDLSPVAVAAIDPASGATLVPPDSAITITLTDPIELNQLSGRLFVSSGGTNLPGTRDVSPDGLVVTFTPAAAFPSSSVIDVLLSKDLTDTFGRKLGSDFVSAFTTGGAIVTGTVFSQSVPVVGADVTLTAGASSVQTATDGTGRYRFENVAPGSVSITAQDGGLAGSAVVDVVAFVGSVTANIDLAFVGSVSGTVTNFDATPVAAGIEVRIFQGVDNVGFTLTLADGTYQVDNIPLGAFAVDVTKPANGDRGQGAGTLTSPGEIASGTNVQLTGLGDLRVVVQDDQTQPVAGASVTVGFTRFGGFASRNGVSAADGSVVFADILAGAVNASADDPASGLQASASTTVVAGVETTVQLVLEPAGIVSGVMLGPDAATPVPGATVRIYRDSGNVLKAEASSAADGSFSFSNLPVVESPYRIDVLVSGRLRARERAIAVAADTTTNVSLTLIGLGTVDGTIVPPSGESLSSSVIVTLTSLAPDIGGIFTDTDGSDANYELLEIPVGAFRITARDNINGFLGEAEGSVTVDGETVTVDIQLIDNAVTFGSSILKHDANAFQYRVRADGALTGGNNSLFTATNPNGLNLSLSRDGGSELTYVGLNTGSEEDNGRELVTATELLDGIQVHRKIAVPVEGYFARYLELLENTTGSSANVSVTLTSNINNRFDGFPRVVDSSGGDAIADDGDVWVVTDDLEDIDPFIGGSIPPLGFVLTDGTGLAPALVSFAENVGSTDGELTVRYDVTIPAGGRVVFLHFVAMEITQSAAALAAARLTGLPPEALEGLALDEIADIVNFTVPGDGVSAVEPLPPLDGVVSGDLLAEDGTTRVGSSTGVNAHAATFQSDHPLFRRLHTASSQELLYSFAGNLELQGSSPLAVPRFPYAVSTKKIFGALSVSAAGTGDFLGSALLGHSPDAVVSATSESGTGTGASKAFDFGFSDWRPASGVTTATLQVVIPSDATVERVRLTPDTTTATDITDVLIELFDATDQLLDSRLEPFAVPNAVVVVDYAPVIPGVRRVAMTFTGSSNNIRIEEADVIGAVTDNIGTSFTSLTYSDSASLDITVVDAGGAPAPTDFTFQSATQSLGSKPNTNGSLFFAPAPVSANGVTVFATADDPSHSLVKVEVTVPVIAGETHPVALSYPETATLSGLITDFTGAPAAHSLVLFADTGAGAGGQISNISSNTSGVYTITDLPSGDYRLRIIENGRILFFLVTVAAPTNATLNVQVPIIRDVAVTVLFETADASPLPANLAFVTVKDSLDAAFRTVGSTNASGQRTAFDVAQGPFTLRVRHPSVLSSETDFVGVIDAPGTALPMSVTIPAFGTLTGVVTLADGTTPVASAGVDVVGTGIAPASTTTNGAGSYTFTNIQAIRPLTVTAKHPTAGREHIVAVANGEVSGQGQTSTLDVNLPGTGTVEVTVVESDGTTPVAGADVSIQDSFSSTFRAEGVSDAAGLVTITVVPEGGFTARAEDTGLLIGEAAGTMPIGAAGDVIQVTITRANASAEGTVLALDGLTPVPLASVELRSEDASTLIDTTTADEDGFYQFAAALPPATTLTLRALFPDDNTIQTEAQVSATQAGEVITTDLTLDVSVIKGFAFDAGGVTPLSATSVFLTPFGTLDQSETTTDVQGFFAFFNFGEGHYELSAEDPFGLAARVPSELLPGEVVLEQDIVLPEFGTVEGFVTDNAGGPLTGADVVLTNANILFARTASPDGTGLFRFDRVALGSFALTYDHPTADIDPNTGTNVIVPGNTVGELTSAGSTVSADIALPATGTVFGEIRDGGVAVVANEGTQVSLEGRQHETSDGFYQRNGDSDSETINVTDVPVGEVSAVGRHVGDIGEASGTVTETSSTELNPELGTVVSLPHEPEPAAAERHQVTFAGTLLGEADNGGFEPEFSLSFINGKSFPIVSVAAEELGGEQVVVGPVRLAGVTHTRKFHVPSGAAYARALYIFENTNAVDMSLSMFLEGDVFVDADYVTSSGGDILVPDDSYFVGTNDDGTGIGVVFAGAGSVRRPDFNGDNFDFYSQEWRNIVVPAGGRVILMAFFIQAPDLAMAQSRADDLMNLTNPSVTSDLTAAEKADIVNFIVP